MSAILHRNEVLSNANRDPFVFLRGGTRAAYLDLRVHLVNGKMVRFIQTDTAAATRLIAQIRPDRAFSERQLTIVDGETTTTFPTDVIERLDFLTSPAPNWQPETATIREVPEGARNLTAPAGIRCQAELFSGGVVNLDVCLRNAESPLMPVDLSLYLTRLFSGKSVVGAREGGLFLLNPANIMRVVSHSAEATVAPGSLQARRVRERRIAW